MSEIADRFPKTMALAGRRLPFRPALILRLVQFGVGLPLCVLPFFLLVAPLAARGEDNVGASLLMAGLMFAGGLWMLGSAELFERWRLGRYQLTPAAVALANRLLAADRVLEESEAGLGLADPGLSDLYRQACERQRARLERALGLLERLDGRLTSALARTAVRELDDEVRRLRTGLDNLRGAVGSGLVLATFALGDDAKRAATRTLLEGLLAR
jgi:hypothetical protein